jgi:hypothetical protein
MEKGTIEDIWLIVTIGLASGFVVAASSYTFLNWIP